MKELLLLAAGGCVGSIVRFWLGKKISERGDWTFPVGTFTINISGAILLGVLLRSGIGKDEITLLGDGFLGAYTTFSTFSYEGYKLMEEGFPWKAAGYLFGSLILGVLGFGIGYSGF